MKPVVRFGLALSIVGALGACGSDSTGPEFGDTFTQAEGIDLANGSAGEGSYLLERMQFGTPQLIFFAPSPARRPLAAPRMQRHAAPFTLPTERTSLAAVVRQLQAVAPGCSTTASGTSGDPFDWYDGNGNDIPDDWHVKIACAGQDSAGEVIDNWVQTIEVTVTERTADIWGFDAKFTVSGGDHYSTGDFEEGGFEGSEHLSVVGSHADYSVSQKEWERDRTDGDTQYWEDADNGSAHFVPAEGTLALETPFQSGELTLNVELRTIDPEDGNVRWIVDTPDPLLYSPACLGEADQAFVGGQLRGRLDGSSERGFTIDFFECGAGYDGELHGYEGEVPATRHFAGSAHR